MAFMKFSKGKPLLSIPNGLGEGAFFDGSSYAKLTCKDLPIGTNPTSISVRFNQKEGDGLQTICGYGDNDTNAQKFIMTSFPYMYGHGWYSDAPYEQKEIVYNKWYHTVFVYENGIEKCYLDGELLGQRSFSFNTVTSGFEFRIGTQNDDRYFNGNIANLQVFNRALSADEVTQLYNKQEITSGRVLNVPLTYGKDNESIFTSKSFVYDYSILTTSSGFDEWGYPIRYDIASECGIAYSLLPTKGLIFYAPCETDVNVEVGNQFTDSGSYTTQIADDIPCLKFNSPCRQEVDTNVFVKNQVTLSAWYYYTTSGDRVTILGYGYDRTFCAFCLQETNGQFTIERASGRFETGFYFENNKWYHLSVTLDNDTIKCYVNGELVNTFTYAMDVHSGNLAIGGWVGGGYSPNGYITKCRIYNRPLTDKEIKALAKEV